MPVSIKEEAEIIPKFKKFRVVNKEIRNSVAYKEFLKKLLQQEFNYKKQRYRLLERNLKSVFDKLLLNVDLYCYNQVCNLFLVKSKSLRSHQKILSKKLLALTKGINNVDLDTKTVIFKFFKYKLTKQEDFCAICHSTN